MNSIIYIQILCGTPCVPHQNYVKTFIKKGKYNTNILHEILLEEKGLQITDDSRIEINFIFTGKI